MSQQVTIKAGQLKKQAAGSGPVSLMRRSQRRWFVFQVFAGLPTLDYYEDVASPATSPPINSFDLRGCKHVIQSPSDPATFMLTLSDRVLTLTADSEAEAASWVSALNGGLSQFGSREKPDNVYGTFDAACGYFESDQQHQHQQQHQQQQQQDNEYASEDDIAGIKEMERSKNEVNLEVERLQSRLLEARGEKAAEQFRHELLSLSDGVYEQEHNDSDRFAELDEMDSATYELMESKYRELEDWVALGQLRAKRSRSVAGVHKPNPDPPPYQHLTHPIPLAGFFDRKTDVSVEEEAGGRFFVNPLGPGGPRLSALGAAVERLKRQILFPGGVAVRCRCDDLLQYVAVVQVAGRFWIAGWSKLATRLHSCLHVGDQVMSVDGLRIESLDQLKRILQGAYKEAVLRLRRCPHAKVFCIRRPDGQSLGLQLDGHKAQICFVQPEGMAAMHGFCNRAAGVVDDTNFTTWTITEVNGRPLSLWPEQKEVELRLNAHGQEISLTVQPTDLIKAIKGQLKKVKDYKQFVQR